MKLNDFAKTLIGRFPLGFVATVTPDGSPSLSPKGTFLVLDDETIGFAEIRSPNTMTNLASNPALEVNFIDQWLRKGIRIRGDAQIHGCGSDGFDGYFQKWEAVWPTLAHRMNAIIVIPIESVKLLTTPPYDDGMTEEEMVELYKQKFAEIYPS